MHKSSLLLLGLFTLTLFSFRKANPPIFEEIAPSLYRINIGTGVLSEVELLTLHELIETTGIEGAGKKKTVSIFKTKICKEVVSDVLTLQDQKDCPCPKEKDLPEQIAVLEKIIEKYQ